MRGAFIKQMKKNIYNLKTKLLVEYVDHKNIDTMLTSNMKRLLTNTIKLPNEVLATIDQQKR